MMLTEQQLTETALRFVHAHVTDLLDSAFEMDDHLDKQACEQHCGGGCERTEEDWPAERKIMRNVIRAAVEDLRDRIVERASDEGIDLKVSA